MIARLAINPRARRGADSAAAVREELAAAGVAFVEDVDGTPPGRPYDCIVSAGGDGTFISLIPDAMARDVPMGIIPLGTFNDLARTLGVPSDLRGACDIIAAGATRRIDVGRVNGALFVNEASIGLSSRIARLQTTDIKQRFGVFAVIGTTLSALSRARPMHVSISFDGQLRRERAVQVTVANSHCFGGVFDMEDAAIDDAQLDCYVFPSDNAARGFAAAIAMQRNRRPVEGMRAYRSTQFTLTTRRGHHISADGEPAGKTPAVFDIIPSALRVFASTQAPDGSQPTCATAT